MIALYVFLSCSDNNKTLSVDDPSVEKEHKRVVEISSLVLENKIEEEISKLYTQSQNQLDEKYPGTKPRTVVDGAIPGLERCIKSSRIKQARKFGNEWSNPFLKQNCCRDVGGTFSNPTCSKRIKEEIGITLIHDEIPMYLECITLLQTWPYSYLKGNIFTTCCESFGGEKNIDNLCQINI